MAKLSKYLLGSLLFQCGLCSDFKLISCNNKGTGRPELSYAVSKAYFEKYMSAEKNNYTLNGSYYIRTINENYLSLAFSDKDDAIKLSYTARNTGKSLNIDNYRVIFADESVRFECSYKRSIDINSSFDIALTTTPLTGTGNLGYKMEVKPGVLGERTSVSVTPNHIYTQIYPRVVECKVVNEKGQNPVYLIHSMDKGAVCIDKSRFAATQTSWSPKFEFSYRSFRYQGDSDAKQKQTLQCKLHLDPKQAVSQPKDCTCHTPASCKAVIKVPGNKLIQKARLLTPINPFSQAFMTTFEIYATSFKSRWQHILSVSQDGHSHSKKSVFSLFYHGGWKQFSLERNGDASYAVKYGHFAYTMPTKKWTKFQIFQNKQGNSCALSITIEGRSLKKLPVAACFKPDGTVNAYASAHNYNPLKGYIKDFTYEPISESNLNQRLDSGLQQELEFLSVQDEDLNQEELESRTSNQVDDIFKADYDDQEEPLPEDYNDLIEELKAQNEKK